MASVAGTTLPEAARNGASIGIPIGALFGYLAAGLAQSFSELDVDPLKWSAHGSAVLGWFTMMIAVFDHLA
jgi:hypothetical protein